MDMPLIPLYPEKLRRGEKTPLERTARIRLIEERKNRGWSQKDLADHLGTTQHNVSRWEAGLTTPGPYFRTKLCELFDISIHDLLFPQSNTDLPGLQPGEVITQLFLDFKQQTRQLALAGDWRGTAHDGGRELEYIVTLLLKPLGRALQGEGQLSDAAAGADIAVQSVRVAGRLVYDRFLMLEYTLEEPPGAIQFGLLLLEFSTDGQTLHGGFVGYGALVTRGITMGTVHLQKQRARMSQEETTAACTEDNA
jgi:transcriptional regulator with XRE-family HTH domain